MIHLYREAGRLYISRGGRLTSVDLEQDRAVQRMLVRLEDEGRVRRFHTRSAFFDAHQLAVA